MTTNAVKHISITNKSLNQSHSTICNPLHRKIPVAYAKVKDAREAKCWKSRVMCNRRWQTSKRGSQQVCVTWALNLPVAAEAAISPGHGCCLLLQDQLHSWSRVGRGMVEDM